MNREKADFKQQATVFLTQQWGEVLAIHFVFSDTSQFTDLRGTIELLKCNQCCGAGFLWFIPQGSDRFCILLQSRERIIKKPNTKHPSPPPCPLTDK